ncbi:MAG: hypothetical protein QOE28_1266 [Solirubrobacteraceae bacterium]|nr:hypothetical protein [Solirubrobacteraceae bacterium]
MRAALAAVVLTLVFAAPAAAQDCLSASAPPVSAPAQPLRFGIAPQAAGSAGAQQGTIAPEDPAKALAALGRLGPPGRDLVVRLNRMFWSDGDAGLARYAGLVDGYARAGYRSELQVRYHPPQGHEGDIAGWLDYVRAAVRMVAPRRSVVELSITNEANLPGSPNTSDGSYAGVVDALVQGVEAARAEADRLGRRDLAIGFTYAYRSSPQGDDTFFEQLAAKGGAAFARAVDHVGLQVYPGVFWPPATSDPAGDVIEALTLLRDCWLPKAGLGRNVALWVTENGYATRGGQGTDAQAADLRATLDAISRYSGTLGITDYRYFNLRDNSSAGPDLFDAVGLLFDDYREKPAFGVLRDAIARTGTAPGAGSGPGAAPAAARPPLRVAVSPRRVARGRRTLLRVRVTAAKQPVRGALVRVGDRRARTGSHGRARLRYRFAGRPGPRRVRVTKPGYARAYAPVRVTRRVTAHAAPAGARASAACPLFPPSFSTNRRVDSLPVAPDSAAIVASIGLDEGLHADFGSGTYEGGPIGIPFDVVNRRTPRSKVRFDYADESDRIRYPIPRHVHIEGGGDRHALLLDRARCRLSELYALRGGPGAWRAGSGATWNLRSKRLRPAGWTSADAAGLPILPLLARYGEVKRGRIGHALRVTVQRTRRAYVYPARHFASDDTDPSLPRMGERLRLKAGVDISHLPRQARIVALALKRYGLIVADNGSDWFVSGAPDRGWSNDQLARLHSLTGRDFEVVRVPR